MQSKKKSKKGNRTTPGLLSEIVVNKIVRLMEECKCEGSSDDCIWDTLGELPPELERLVMDTYHRTYLSCSNCGKPGETLCMDCKFRDGHDTALDYFRWKRISDFD
jgi:hypothetical protein